MNPDWVGVAVHYPDGRIVMVQVDAPVGVIETERDTVEQWGGYSVPVGPTRVRVEFEGFVGDMQSRRGPRPDWPTAPAGEITEAPRAIEGS